MRENFMSGIDEGRQDKPSEACFLLYSDILEKIALFSRFVEHSPFSKSN